MKRLLSIMLVLMLVLSMAATAFAVDKVTTTPEAWLTKTYNDPIGYPMTFKFDIKQDSSTNAPLLRIADITYNAGETGGNKASQLVFELAAAVPGIYHYTVTENQDGAINDDREKLIMSQAKYDVEVTVSKVNGVIAVTNIAVTQITNPDNPDDNGTKVDVGEPAPGDANGFNFVNTYAKEAGPDDPNLGSLKISKDVVNGLDPDQEFTFNFTYTPPAGGNPFEAQIIHSGNKAIDLNTQRMEATFSLKDGQYVLITGLPIGTTVNVTESGTAKFVPSATPIFNGNKEPAVNAGEGADLAVTGKTLGEAQNLVAVKNTRSEVPATGVILNVLPYVLMVAIAGGMIVLFTVMKRRKAQDYED